ncbi:hypothetical protein Cni_G05456 [Canna indica]|uniref:Dolichyl-diphosphooligosaccharide--protein glycosyltransferase subunit KCP2 n=1 Tax=Canna indica TaxID=4628 RepID=A0AAQ3JX15_9LILI|nr:hypothetical protein Cni_G05456 [Canna indica]
MKYEPDLVGFVRSLSPNPVSVVSVAWLPPTTITTADAAVIVRIDYMAAPGRSMLYSLLSFAIILSLLEMYSGKLASSELFTILGGFISSLLFLMLLTFIGNYQELNGTRTGWGAVVLAEIVALIAAATVHRVCITTCFLFSAGLLYEVDKLSGVILSKSESKGKRY